MFRPVNHCSFFAIRSVSEFNYRLQKRLMSTDNFGFEFFRNETPLELNRTYVNGPALSFRVVAESHTGARASELILPHGKVEPPVFMPVGTQATIKGLTSKQMEDIGYKLILSNTYHLGLRPGADIVDQLGGIHEFMQWPNNLLTDSGGFQMVSLFHLSKVSEDGVEFQSPVDGTTMLLTPEKSIQLQNQIGSDIMMALDDVIASTTTGERVEEATYRTIRWIDRCISAHSRPKDQNLFAIVQGGLDPKLRKMCLTELVKRDLPGYAIGGLAGGEDKNLFWRVVYLCCTMLPRHKPRYLMGVGYPLDLVVCSVLGVDMFDCVYPCRTARFGTALVPEDTRPIQEGCPCLACQKYTRAYLSSIVQKDAVVCHLITIHNLTYLYRLMKDLRQSILDDKLESFVKVFLKTMFPSMEYPEWVKDAMKAVSIDLTKH